MMLQSYINMFIGFIVVTAMLYLPIYFVLKKNLSYLLLLWSLFLIVYATLILFQLPLSFSPNRHILNLRPLLWLEEGHIPYRIKSEIIPNIMMFIPCGFCAPLAIKRLRKWHLTAIFALAITFSVEFIQYFLGRSADIDDICANLLGGIIGYILFRLGSCLHKE